MGILSRPKGTIVPIEEDEEQADNLNLSQQPVITVNRKCRDVGFLLLFALFWAGNVLVGINAVQYGDPKRLMYFYTHRDYPRTTWAIIVASTIPSQIRPQQHSPLKTNQNHPLSITWTL